MRICVSGTACTGKTTLVNNFLDVWTMYKTPEKTYRDVIAEKKLSHSANTTTDTQWAILEFMVDQLQSTTPKDKIIFDRCPFDNLVYTLWAHDKGLEGFDKVYVDKCIKITKESLRSLDLILLLRYDQSIPIVEDGTRETNKEYIIEIDNIFTALLEQYKQNYESDIFFPANDSPGIIELPTGQQARIDLISQYLNAEGEIYGDEHSLFNPEKLDELEALVKQQKAALESEENERALFEKFGMPKLPVKPKSNIII
jgi:nicotinamide riboside kinase